jgi:hypothetical protein
MPERTGAVIALRLMEAAGDCRPEIMREVIARAAVRRQARLAAEGREAWMSRQVQRATGGSLCRDALHRV